MLEQTKRISFRISSVSSKAEPDLQTGSGQNVPAPAPQHNIVSRLFYIYSFDSSPPLVMFRP